MNIEEEDQPRGHLWHPFANMASVVGNELEVSSADGVWVYDSRGRRYLDASAGLWYANIGHGRIELAEAAKRQMAELESGPIFGDLAHRPALELADRVCELAPLGPESAAFFTSGGSDSVDTAAKMARRYWQVRAQPQRRKVIAMRGAYHGVNSFGTSLSGIPRNATGWGPLVTDVIQIERFDLDGLALALSENEGRIAAFFGEPVQGASGVHPPPDGFWTQATNLLKDHDVLMIADEVVTGFGRVGTWFASERYGIDPDIMLTAKGLSSGYLPIGAVLVSGRVRNVLWSTDAGNFNHGYTYSGHPVACAVALANLDILEREALPQRVAELEPILEGELQRVASHRHIAEVRVAGLLGGVDLTDDCLSMSGSPDGTAPIVHALRERNVLIRGLLGRTLQISPPFVIEADQITTLADTLLEVLDAIPSRVEAPMSDDVLAVAPRSV